MSGKPGKPVMVPIFQCSNSRPVESVRITKVWNELPDSVQARSKQCLIGPAITKLSAGDLGAG